MLSHIVDRLSFDVDQPYDRFRRRYELAVPFLDQEKINGLVQRSTPWEEVVADANMRAPFWLFSLLEIRYYSSHELSGS